MNQTPYEQLQDALEKAMDRAPAWFLNNNTVTNIATGATSVIRSDGTIVEMIDHNGRTNAQV